MKRTILVTIIILFFLSITSSGYSASYDFEKGVVYLLLGDYQQSKVHFGEYFKDYPNPIVRRGFMLLADKDKKKAKTEFQSYLNMNFRSLHGIVGISLSLSDLKESTSKENLMKAVRLNKGFSSSYACLGMEYLKEQNFPMAEKYLLSARRISNLMEYRLLLGELYLRIGQPGRTVSLIENDSANNPDNFFLNYLMARSLFKLNRLRAMGKYILISKELNRTNKDVQLLYANYLLKKGEPKAAREVLKGLRYKETNPEYIKTYAKALLTLGNRRSKTYLYQYYTIDNWDKDINRFLGLYYFRNKTEKSNIQNWIYRSILCGNSIESLKKDFSPEYHFPVLDSLRFFDLKNVFWIDNNRLFVVGVLYSGAAEKLFLINFRKRKIVASYSYDGIIDGVYFSSNRDRIILETEDPSSKKTKLYAMIKNPNGSFQFRGIYTGRNDIPAFDVVFNSSGTEAYFVDKRIEKISFDSPFSIVNRFGEKRPVYTGLSNFGLYKYNFVNRRFTFLEDIAEINKINSDSIKKFLMVYNAAVITKEVGKLISKGEKLDSFSSEIVRIVFSKNLCSFMIYLADLKNAFQAVIFDDETGRIIKIDSTMFLDADRFAELDIIDFDSDKANLILSTKDKRRELIIFNYKSKLYRKLVENYYSSCFGSNNKNFYVLTERNKRHFLTETLLKIISIKPFWIEELPSRRDLKSVVNCNDIFALRMSTNGGESLEMGPDNKFIYTSPSFEGSVFGFSSDRKNVAVFVNKRLFLIENNSAWDRKAPLKK
ncbi:MAG: hypothetical protein KAS97_13600 [Candidatus Aminicenantes bacterium]|nr:hypothetical protein [Candidatus Aminicenantes bacterium]